MMRDIAYEQIHRSTTAELAERVRVLNVRYSNTGYTLPQLRELQFILSELYCRANDLTSEPGVTYTPDTKCGWCDQRPIDRWFADATGVCNLCWPTVRRETAGFPNCPICHHRYWLMEIDSCGGYRWGFRCLGCHLKFTAETAATTEAAAGKAKPSFNSTVVAHVKALERKNDVEKLVLQPNLPECIALKFADGKLSEGRFGDQMFYTLVDGRGWYADLDVAAKVNLLELRPHEPFWVCKRMSGQRGSKPIIDVYRGDVAPQVRAAAAATGLPPTEVEAPQPPAPQRVAVEGCAGASAATPAPASWAAFEPPRSSNGNGSSGHGANGSPANGAAKPPYAARIPASLQKVPYDVALRRILHSVVGALKAEGEQWSDESRQRLVSTLVIQACEDGVITWGPSLYWEAD
jgi:hypothetical protein